MRRTLGVWILLAFSAFGQQAPFVQITQPTPPKGAALLFEDSEGRLWLGGTEPGSEGLTYFDGSRFVPAVSDFPKILVTGMAEDTDGGIWIASNDGVYRAFRRQLTKIVSGSASWGITRVAPDVFLVGVAPLGTYDYPASQTGESSELLHIAKTQNRWLPETAIHQFSGARFWLDPSGRILFHCLGGFCEFRGDDVLNWHPGVALQPKEHAFLITGDSTVLRDRFGCIWMRAVYETAYQCPGDPLPTKLPGGMAKGELEIRETSNGTMVLPAQNSLALGRPGGWRVFTPANGYPMVASSAIGRDGSIWMSNAKGLFLLPSHLRMELWTEHDGVDGAAFSVLPIGNKVFAAVGDAVRVLDADRTRWRVLTEFPVAVHVSPGPNHTLMFSSRSIRDRADQVERRDFAQIQPVHLAGDGASAGWSNLVRGRRNLSGQVWPPVGIGTDQRGSVVARRA